MKPLYLIFVFSIILSIRTNAQYLEIGNKWIYDHRFYIGAGHYTEKIDSIEIVSDTVINDLSYFKLVASEMSPCGLFKEVEYIREEEGKVYRLRRDGINENLMIDFNAVDSYDMDYEVYWGGNIIEVSVEQDSLETETLPDGSEISVKYQRIINNSSYDDNTVYKLVDRIGYIQYGFLFPDIGTGLCDVDEFQTLRCFISQNDTIHLTEFDCYESSIKVATQELSVQEFTVHPNPGNGLIHLSETFDQVKIFDMSGKEYDVDLENSMIDLTGFENGFYLIQLIRINDNTVHTSKFIKI